jgi:hypothetical protein
MTQVCSVYSQLLQLFPRGQFAQVVKQHQAEFNAKGFTCWEQFVAMLFCQVAHLNSLREVCLGLAGCESPLKHLGISTTPKRSTLAYANANRPWELYELVFMQLLERCQAETAVHSHRNFRFKNKLTSLDGSIIELSATMFDWAKYRQRKGAIKLHLLLDHDGYSVSHLRISQVPNDRPTAVSSVLASFRMEGLEPDPETSALLTQYTGGTLSLEKLGSAIERHVAQMEDGEVAEGAA